jgi:hypothetical protein
MNWAQRTLSGTMAGVQKIGSVETFQHWLHNAERLRDSEACCEAPPLLDAQCHAGIQLTALSE